MEKSILTMRPRRPVSNMLNRLHGQPESYDKKYAHYVFDATCRCTNVEPQVTVPI